MSLLQVVWFNGTRLCLLIKRLEKGSFSRPNPAMANDSPWVKLGKLTETLIEEPEGTGTTKTRKPVAPNNITRNYTYEPKRDLIATLNDKRGTTAVVNRSYEYNALGIPSNRTIQRQGKTRNDVFTHNDRAELTAATIGDKSFAYDYDNIGNRKTAQGRSGRLHLHRQRPQPVHRHHRKRRRIHPHL